jgi:hypothetical protein
MITGVNVINILRAAFSFESYTSSFSTLTNKVCTILRKEIGVKAARKMLVKKPSSTRLFSF